MENEITLTESQLKRFEKLWFIFGNGGKKHTMGNHKLIQGFYQYKKDRREVYANKIVAKEVKEKFGEVYYNDWRVTDECLTEVNDILKMP